MSQLEQRDQENQVEKQSKWKLLLQEMGARLGSILLEHWGTKLLALLIAVALWAGLISQDPTLTREKTFNDVPVNIIGSDTLRRNGYIVLEDLNAVLDDVTLTVNVPQGQYGAAQASHYSVRIDLSRIREAGKQEVRILSTNSSTYGTVARLSTDTVELTVDEYVTRYRIPVVEEVIGTAPEGYYATDVAIDPSVVAVSGPKSVVERIASARVTVDQSALEAQEGHARRALPLELLDSEGKVIRSSLLQVTSESVLVDSVIVDQQVYAVRTVALDQTGLVLGKPAHGYEIKDVFVTPSSLTIAGRASIIEDMNLFYADGTVNVDGRTTSINKALRVRQPATVNYVSTDEVTVAVEIGPIIVERTWNYVPVMVQHLAVGLEAELSNPTVNFYATGEQLWMDSLTRSELAVWCDMSSITAPGTYTLSIGCDIKHDEARAYTCQTDPFNIEVIVTEKE